MGDPDQLQQVLLNLAVNARDAMPDGGDLIFETDNVEISGNGNNQSENAKRGRYIRITVADTGCGIASEIQDRVFDPFFTAKKQGEGTGMGLAMVYGIVQNHEGSIDLDSEEGRGTRLKVYLPLTVGSPAIAAAPEKIEPIRGNGRILVVDDEEVVRRLIDDLLTDLGYEVVTVDDGVEAVEYYKKFSKEIDLAIIDMIMPRMGGHECFRAFKEIDPKVRAILITGYSRDGAAQEILDEGMLGFAQKPFQGGQLSEVVASALAADPA